MQNLRQGINLRVNVILFWSNESINLHATKINLLGSSLRNRFWLPVDLSGGSAGITLSLMPNTSCP